MGYFFGPFCIPPRADCFINLEFGYAIHPSIQGPVEIVFCDFGDPSLRTTAVIQRLNGSFIHPFIHCCTYEEVSNLCPSD